MPPAEAGRKVWSMKRAFSACLVGGILVAAFLSLVILSPAISHAPDPIDGKRPTGGVDLAGREYAAAAALRNRQQYELAAQEWAQFIEDRIRRTPARPRARHYLGLCQLKNQQYAAAALNLLGGARCSPPPADCRPDALKVELEGGAKDDLLESTYLYLGLAQYNAAQASNDSAQQQQLRQQAAQSFTTPEMQKYPQGKYLAQGLFYQGEVAYAQGQKQQAAAAYKQVVERFPGDDLAPEALYALGVTQEELGQAAAAAATTLPRS